jgi:hypothetical protein
MPNDAFTQQALAAEPRFQLRLANALSKVAWEIIEEDPATPHHAERVAYAQKVTGSSVTPSPTTGPAMFAAQLAPSFVNRPNVFAFATTYDFTVGSVVTASGDADIESQLHTDWDELSGVVA